MEVGLLADLVLWKPENFGIKPSMVIKSGVIAWSQVCLTVCPLDYPLTAIDRWVTQTPLSRLSNQSFPSPCGELMRLLRRSTRSALSPRYRSIQVSRDETLPTYAALNTFSRRVLVVPTIEASRSRQRMQERVQEGHEMERYDAQDDRRPRNVRRACRWCPHGHRSRGNTSDDQRVQHLLKAGYASG